MSETTPLLSNSYTSTSFPYSLHLKITASEPRDVLQAERTCLSFLRFCTGLFFAAIGVVTRFSFDADDDSFTLKYTTGIALVLMVLAFASIVVCGFTYKNTLNRYASHRIHTSSLNLASVVSTTLIVLGMAGVSVSMLVERYEQ